MHHPLNLLIAAGAVASSLAFLSLPTSVPETVHSSSEIDLSALQNGEKGAELYAQWCASCHGVNGRDFIQRAWKLGSQQADIERIIRNGYALLGMPAYGQLFSPDEIKDLSYYLLAKAGESPNFRPSPPQLIQASDLQLRANVIQSGIKEWERCPPIV